MLGSGTYGDVFLAKDTLNGDKLVAIKRSKFDKKSREGYTKSHIREISMLQEHGFGPTKHPNIVELIEVF